MKATDILMSEHRIIERVICAVEKGAQRLESGEPIRPAFFLDAAQFIKGFADGCHHHKEEGVLFKMMEQVGVPVEGGPLGVMFFEHEQGRIFTAGMRAAAERLIAGDASAAGEVVRNAASYAALLRQHIQKEDNVLYPMAIRFIPLAQQSSLLDGFERVEHVETGEGVHEKYLALADSLEREMA